MDILVSFLILKETLSAFHNCIWCCLYVCHIWSLLCRGVFPLYPLCWKFLILSGYCCFSVAQLYPTRPFATPWTAAHQVSLSITNFRSFLKLMSVESMIPSNYLILQCHCLCLPSVFPSIKVFSNESTLRIRSPKYCSFSFRSVLPMNIQGWFPLGLTAWISLLSKGLSKSLLQHHSLKASILLCSAFFFFFFFFCN